MRPIAIVFLFCACSGRTPSLGGYTLPISGTVLQVKGPGKVELDNFTGGTQAYAPAAVRTAAARYEMSFGSWRITDQPNAWTEAKKFEWRTVKSDSANGAYLDADGKVLVTLDVSSNAAGELALFVKAADTAIDRLTISFACGADDAFLGFGGQQDALDHRGHTVPIWTSEPGIGKDITDDNYPDLWFLEGTRHASSYGLPTWYSNRGYVGVVETDRRSIFELCSARAEAWRIEVWDNQFTLHLFAGDGTTRPITQATREVLGLPMRPPLVAFAPWNDAIFGTDNVRRVADELRDAGAPSSVIWTEDFRGGADSNATSYRLRENWDLDPTLYPDAGELAAGLQRDGFAWLAYFNTFIVQGQPIFDEALDGGHFVKDSTGAPYLFQGPSFEQTGLADLSRPETREWVKSHMRKALDVGFSGWMADYGEWLPHDAVLSSGEDPLAAHNRYPREWDTVNDEVLAERTDGKQYVFFGRSGWLKSNAVTPTLWAGDQRTDFEPDDGFPTVVPYGLGLGLAGVSTFGTDIPGYQSATNAPSTKELFFRWTELGALTPLMRTHHGSDARHSWKFDSDAETLAHWVRWSRFHIALVPFFDGLSAIAEKDGVPAMRALALEYPLDAAGWKIDDEWMLGDALLVAPVLTEGAVSRDVYFPPGNWVSLDGAQKIAGGVTQHIDAALGEIPIFLRAGAVVPRAGDGVLTVLPSTTAKSYDPAVRRLLVASGGDGTFTERDGTTYQVSATSSTGFTELGAALGTCFAATMRSCVDHSGPNPIVRLSSQSDMEFPGGSLVFTPGPQPKTYDVEVVAAR